MAGKPTEYLVARESFMVDGVMVQRGSLVESADPVVKGREHLFDKPEARFRTTRRS